MIYPNCNNWDDLQMKNPNLYVTLADSVESGYILAEDGSLILAENNADIFYYGE